MKAFLTQIFTWWNGQTLGTRLHTWRFGERVGEDAAGNVYYRRRGGAKDKALGYERRWVIYKGVSDPTTVPPGWYGWLHYTVDTPPPEESYAAPAWQAPHQPNMTGTVAAYRPRGSVLSTGRRQPTDGDYSAWTP